MINEQMKQLLDVCVALSAERDREALLFRILDTAMVVRLPLLMLQVRCWIQM